MITDYDPNTEMIYYWNIVTDPAIDIVADGPNQGNENRITDASSGLTGDISTGELLQTWLNTYGDDGGNDKEIPQDVVPIYGLVLGFYGADWYNPFKVADVSIWKVWNITDYDLVVPTALTTQFQFAL